MPSVSQRLHAPISTRAVDRQNLTVDFVVSTPDIDSYGTRIDQSGWDLEQFKKNPVITWAHDDRGHTPSGGLPIANAIPETIRVENGNLVMKMKFTPEDVNPFGYRVFRLIEAGFLHGSSVGFDPTEEETIQENGQSVLWYRKQRLVEVAVVTIPSNDAALARRAKELNREDQVEEIRQIAEEVEQLAKEHEATDDTGVIRITKELFEEFKKHSDYFKRKQPANKAATRVLKKFYQLRNEDPPADEVEAWEGVEEKLEEPKVEPAVEPEPIAEEVTPPTPEPVVEPIPEEVVPPPPQPSLPAEAPQDARKASVQIPLTVLAEFPQNLTRAYVDAAVEALRQGIPVKDACSLIDGMNSAVSHSLTTPHGANH